MEKFTKDIKKGLEVYGCVVRVVVTKDGYKEVLNIFKKAKQLDRWEKEGPKDDHFSGFAIDLDLDKYILLFNTIYPIDHHTITHEVWHLVNYIFDQRGIVENKDHEAGAWLAGYLAQEVYKFLEEKNIKVI